MSEDMNQNNNPYSSLFETYGPGSRENQPSSEGSQSNASGSYEQTQQTAGSYGQSSYSSYEQAESSSNRFGANLEYGKKKKEKKEKKHSGGIFKKAVALVLAGVLFGGVAGGTIVGVNYAAQKTGLISSSKDAGSAKIAVATNSGSSSSSSGALADVSTIVDQVLPSVVAITNSQIYQSYSDRFGGDEWESFFNYYFGGNGYGNRSNGNSSDGEEVEAGRGSGIIIGQNNKELLIVTNYHVIENADSLTITYANNETTKATVKGTDSDNDLAVVAVPLEDISEETQKAIAIATLNTSGDCKVGQGVIAIGNALGYGQSITVGYISALDREVATGDGSTKNLLQTDAAINPGNSGGALVNDKGEIIGINSAKYSDTDVEGMGFAIPISKVSDIIDDLMNQETRTEVAEKDRGYLGINAMTIDSTAAKTYNMPEGVYVHSIMENGAAATSDLQNYDIITKLDKKSISTKEDLINQLKFYKKGETVTLTVYRQDGNEYKEKTVTVTLGERVTE